MKLSLMIAFSFLVIASVARADQGVEEAQRALKEQGFYFGEVTGVKDADTGAAIRRYQIRTGLQVNGELNTETITSLRSAVNAARTAATPAARSTPDSQTEERTVTPPQPVTQPDEEVDQPTRDMTSPNSATFAPPTAPGIFAGTPYETAPLQVQRSIVNDAQDILAGRGYYRGAIDGAYGPSTEFALRAYQSQAGIPPSGAFDRDTLAAMQLLPSQHLPRRMLPRRPYGRPPVRGEWIRE